MSAVDELFGGSPGVQTLGDFRFDPSKKLGQGGYAPVFLADEHHDGAWFRKVALKVFATGKGEGSIAQRKRILREAMALCKVKDKNVVKYFSIANDDERGLIGIAMEYVEGKSLAARIEGGPLPAGEVRDVGVSVARALRAIHARNLVHRDVKPANIVDARGVHVLIDFGIAARERVEGAIIDRPQLAGALADFALDGMSAAQLTSAARKTREATLATMGVAGTLGYIDPVCLRTGASAERAADLYALGVTLYECLTGKLPAKAAADTSEDGAAAFQAVLVGDLQPPPVRDVAPETPAGLARIVDRLVEPDAAKRFESADQLLASLEDPASLSEPVAPAPTLVSPPVSRPALASEADVAKELAATRRRLARSTRRRVIAGVLGAIALAGAGVGGWFGITAMESSARRSLDDDWASLQVCLLGEEMPDGLTARARFHEIAALFAETSAAKDYLARCGTYAKRVDEDLPENPKTEKLKTALAPFVKWRESITSEEIEPKITALVDVWRASLFGLSFGKPAADATAPKRLDPLLKPADLDLELFDYDRTKEGPMRSDSFVLAGEAWLGNCRFTREGTRCFEKGTFPLSMPTLPRPEHAPSEADTTQVWDHLLTVDVKAKALVDLTASGAPLATVDPARISGPAAVGGCKTASSPATTWAVARVNERSLVVVSWVGGVATQRSIEGTFADAIGCDDEAVWFRPDAGRSWALCDAKAKDCRLVPAREKPAIQNVKQVQACSDAKRDWVAYVKNEIVYAGPASKPVPIVAPRGKSGAGYEPKLVCGAGIAELVIVIGERARAFDVTALQ